MAPVLRWALPISLLLAEGMGISLLIDLPTAGEAAPLVAALRLAIPVLIGGGAAGWLIARRPEPVALAGALPPPGPWRPAPLLALNLAAYAVLAWLAWRLMGDGAPPPGLAALSGWVAWAAVTVLLALGSAAPLAWSLRLLRERWRLPLLALAAGMLVWRAAAAAEGLWGVLTGSTLHAVGWMVGVLRHDAILDAGEAVVGAGRFEVAIAPVCSGVNGIGLVAVFQSLWIALARSRLRFPRALLLLPAGALLAFAANVVRITLLVLLGAAGLERVAWASFHSKLGWLLFIAIALGSVAAAERVAWLRREPSGEAGGAAEPAVPAAAAAYIAPLLAALAAAPARAKVAFTGYGDFQAVPQGAFRIDGPAAALKGFGLAPERVEARGFSVAALGLFATTSLSDSSRFQMDVTYRDIGEDAKTVRVQYAYLEQEAWGATFRAGKITLPFGWYNQNRFYPFQRPSVSGPVFQSSILGLPIADIGASAEKAVLVGDAVLTADLYAVNGYGPVPGSTGTFRSASLPGGLTIAGNIGRANANHDVAVGGRLELAAASARDDAVGASYYRGAWDPGGRHLFQMAGAHLRGRRGRASVLAEYLRLMVEGDEGFAANLGSRDWHTDSFFVEADVDAPPVRGRALTPWVRYERALSAGSSGGPAERLGAASRWLSAGAPQGGFRAERTPRARPPLPPAPGQP